MLKYANSAKRKRIARLASLIALVVMIPATMTFIQVLQESKYELSFKNYISNEVESNENLWLQRKTLNTEQKQIVLYFNGDVDDAVISDLQNEMKGYENIEDFELIINANKTRNADRLTRSLDRAYTDLDEKDNIISGLQKEIDELKENISGLNQQIESQNTSNNNSIAFSSIAKDAKIRFNDLEYFGYAKMLESSDFIKVDTITVATLKWNEKLNDSLVNVKEIEFKTWLSQELKTDKIKIKRH